MENSLLSTLHSIKFYRIFDCDWTILPAQKLLKLRIFWERHALVLQLNMKFREMKHFLMSINEYNGMKYLSKNSIFACSIKRMCPYPPALFMCRNEPLCVSLLNISIADSDESSSIFLCKYFPKHRLIDCHN